MNIFRYFKIIATVVLVVFSLWGIPEVYADVYTDISRHRQWIRENCPKPEALSEKQLLKEASDIISSGLREEEAVAILRKIAENSPEVTPYIEWLSATIPDTLFKKRLTATHVLADRAMRTGDTAFAIDLKLSYLVDKSILSDVDAELQQLLKEWHKLPSSKENKALGLRIRAEIVKNRNFYEGADNPLLYEEIWNIERETLSLFPADSEDLSVDRASLYASLGALKAIPEENAKIACTLTDRQMDGVGDGTEYELGGLNRATMTNAMWYLRKSVDMYTRLHHPLHPAVVEAKRNLYSKEGMSKAINDELYSSYRASCDYLASYYGSHTWEGLSAKIDAMDFDFRAGVRSYSYLSGDDLIETCRAYSGDSSPNLYYTMMGIIYGCRSMDPSDTRFLDKYLSALDSPEASGISEVKRALFRSGVFLSDLTWQEERAEIEMTKALDVYRHSHDGTPASLFLGNVLSSYAINKARFDMKREVNSIVLADYETLLGKQHPLTLFVKSTNLYYEDFDNWEQLEKDFIAMREKLGKPSDSRYRYMIDNISSQIAANQKYNLFHYPEAMESFIDLGNENRKKGLIAEMITDYAEAVDCAILGRLDLESVAPYVDEVVSSLSEVSADDVNLTALASIGTYFQKTGNAAKAVELLESLVDAHNQTTGNLFDLEYLALRGKLAEAHRANNNIVESLRIFSDDMDQMDKMFFNPTIEVVNYLWQAYDAAASTNNGAMQMSVLMRISNVSQFLINNSDRKEYVAYSLGVPVINEFMRLIGSHLADYYSNLDAIPEDMKAYFDPLLAQLDQFEPLIHQMIEGFPEFDKNYLTNASYLDLHYSSYLYYRILAHNADKALEYLNRYIALIPEIAPMSKLDGYSQLCSLYREMGEEEKAKKAYAVYAETLENMNESSPDYVAGVHTARFNVKLFERDYAGAIENARGYFLAVKGMMDSNFQFMTPAEQDNFTGVYGDPAMHLCALLEYLPETIAAETYDAVLYRTQFQLRSSQNLINAIRKANNPQLTPLLDSLGTLRARLVDARADYSNHDTGYNQEKFQESSTIQAAMNRLQRMIIDMVGEIEVSKEHTGWLDVRDALKLGEAAVEYIYSSTGIMALVLRRDDKAPKAVYVTEWKPFEEALKAQNSSNSGTLAMRLYNRGTVNLYDFLWKPLESELAGAKTVYLSAPGILHSIAFNAIKTPEGKYLFDKYDLRQVTTTAQIAGGLPDSLPESALLVGDILFDPAQKAEAEAEPEDNDDGMRGQEDYTILPEEGERGITSGKPRYCFPYLRHVKGEMARMQQTLAPLDTKVLIRDRASEENLSRAASGAPDIIHLATHGFFIATDTEAIKIPFMKRHLNTIGSPMQRAGVALAGAEETWRGTELPDSNDGILTANEISMLNLKGTKMVVLSACETALGNYSFEGVYGLPRGFKQAGVESLMVSLWTVNDKSTALFMSRFYDEWLKGGSRHEAYRKAVKTVREQYPLPYHWAPFIMLD